jgi:hypothetical protein
MKQTPKLDRAQRDMRPGVITHGGFLGRDSRTLAAILDADLAEVTRLGLTHAQIARRMKELSEAGEKGLGDPVAVPPHYEVRVDSVRGKLRCPFGHAGLFSKVNTTVRNHREGSEVAYTNLNIHMVEAHGFYEGEGAMFRIEPADLARILDVPASGS